MIRNKSYIFSGDMQVITEILDGKTFHQCASRIDEFYRLKFGDTCINEDRCRVYCKVIYILLNIAAFKIK